MQAKQKFQMSICRLFFHIFILETRISEILKKISHLYQII
jgi:hypothetical protein